MRVSTVLAMTTTAAFAAGAASAAPTVDINHAIARVTVIPEARADVAASVVRANARFPITITRTADGITISGGLGWLSANCRGGPGRARVSVLGRGEVGYDDLPQIVVRTPRSVKVHAGGAVYGSVGVGDSLELSDAGCGDWTVADQAGALRVELAGSGAVRAGSAATADLHLAGSGDVSLRSVRDGLAAAVSGSGDIKAGTVNGPLRVRVAGSGDVTVHDGAVTVMDVAVSGSGNVRFGGVASSLEARVSGSGDVSAARVTGEVSKHVSGSGTVSVGR